MSVDAGILGTPERRGVRAKVEGLEELAAAYDALHAACVRRGLCFRREVAAAIMSRLKLLEEVPC